MSKGQLTIESEGFWVVLLAAGSGQRMQDLVADKILAPLGGRSVFAWSLRTFLVEAKARGAIVAYRDDDQKSSLEAVAKDCQGTDRLLWVRGGARRQDSVLRALKALKQQGVSPHEVVLIHDCARPLVQASAVLATALAARQAGAACLAHPARDTIKRLGTGLAAGSLPPALEATPPVALEDLDRQRLWIMETPQAFRLGLILGAYEQAAEQGLTLTDDAAAAVASGHTVALVHHSRPNLKLTTPEDFILAEALLAGNKERHSQNKNQPESMNPLPFRIGHGYDIHRFAAGRKLILGGVEIPHDEGLAGHSDADCLSHAIADALLGALGLPDIGHYFPPSEERWRGMDSQEIIRHAVGLLAERGYQPGNIDATILAEKPKIARHAATMRKCLAQSLGIAETEVGIKATTHEGLGALGRGEGIAAHAVAIVYRKEKAV
jgi:2-C-methyl-D-erythritol 4-phosphate cytidylyltransferase / 2-C-methyl-D-erythritol 2,4-cyclodiphosphate synthase